VPNNNASKFDLDKPARDAVLEGFQVLFHRANLVELTLSLGALVLVTGCNSKPAASDDMKQFRALGAIYAQYMATHQGKTPESNQKLQEFASAQGDSIRQRSPSFPTTATRLLRTSRKDREACKSPLARREASRSSPRPNCRIGCSW
jgi:hypothetical protein